MQRCLVRRSESLKLPACPPAVLVRVGPSHTLHGRRRTPTHLPTAMRRTTSLCVVGASPDRYSRSRDPGIRPSPRQGASRQAPQTAQSSSLPLSSAACVQSVYFQGTGVQSLTGLTSAKMAAYPDPPPVIPSRHLGVPHGSSLSAQGSMKMPGPQSYRKKGKTENQR
jgi:hypothetical protein